MLQTVAANLGSMCTPAAILLSGFTVNYAGLMLDTDIGGLGNPWLR